MARININICLSDIPKDLIKRAGNGKSYINLNINALRETDERGNNHSVSVYVPDEKKQDYPNRIYIGRGREFNDKVEKPVNEGNDLPF